MTRPAVILFLLLAAAAVGAGPLADRDAAPPAPAAGTRFEAVDVYIDPGGKPLAAYQFELTAQAQGEVKLAGLGGGEDHAAFAQPPYYDAAAHLDRRIVVAAFNTGEDLPKARTRVARLMVHVTGPGRPRYTATLQAAAGTDARPIEASIAAVAVDAAGANQVNKSDENETDTSSESAKSAAGGDTSTGSAGEPEGALQ